VTQPESEAREPYQAIPWEGYAANCPVCKTEAEWVEDPALYERIRKSDYPGEVRLIRKVAVGTMNGVDQEVFVVVCQNPDCKTVFFHYKALFNAREIDDAMERKRMRPATEIPEPVFFFHEATVSDFLAELKREPNQLVRQRVLNRLRTAPGGPVLPNV
jgi:hypothetical protein